METYEYSMKAFKPINWTPDPNIGFTVERRDDGGLKFTFTDLKLETVNAWRGVATEHLIDAEGNNRNLYDLSAVIEISETAIQAAIEVNSDPGAHFVRIAVVVANDEVAQALRKVNALSQGVELGMFTDLAKAEVWLERPFSPLLEDLT